MGFLAGPLRPIVENLAIWTGSFGIAVILLTLLVRIILLPFQVKQLKSAAKMRELQPKLKALQDRYKDDPQEMQKQMMEFYRENNYNPLSGCLPLLLQMPIIVGLFQVLREFPTRLAENPGLQEAVSISFLGLDLSASNTIIAIIAGLTTLLSTMAMPGDPSQKKMTAPFAFITLFIGMSLPAGVVLYIIVTNVFTAVQHYIIGRDSAPADSNAIKE